MSTGDTQLDDLPAQSATATTSNATPAARRNGDGQQHLPIALPEPSTRYEQDHEWCVVCIDGQWRQIRFHDYDEIYRVRGLYERLFYDVLQCQSPRTVRKLLGEELAKAKTPPSSLRVLDLGAGNGIMGAEMIDLGADMVVGADIIPEAAAAARRDRPHVYRDYLVADMTALTAAEHEKLTEHEFTALTCIAALGFGDIPPEAFQTAYNLVAEGGWMAFTLKDEFMSASDASGFAQLIDKAVKTGALELRATRRYQHRLDTTGEPLHYVAVVGTKLADLPETD
jgi:SAM-dependent methyltransferase